MIMRKRHLSILLVLLLLVEICPTTFADGNSDFVLEDNGTHLVRYKGKGGHVIIPDGVICIGYEAFTKCASMTSVEIPETVTIISDFAFNNCTGLTSITIPDSVSTIGLWAFAGCTGLTSITIPASVTKIAGNAFEGCTNLSSAVFEDGATVVSGFCNCPALRNVSVPNSIISIQIENCPSLKRLTIPDGVSNLSLSRCTGLTSLSIPDSVTSLSLYQCTGLSSLVIPDSVTCIRTLAGCTGLINVVIPDSVTSIGYTAFQNTKLNSITLPRNLILDPDPLDYEVSGIDFTDLFDGSYDLRDIYYKGTKAEWDTRIRPYIDCSFLDWYPYTVTIHFALETNVTGTAGSGVNMLQWNYPEDAIKCRVYWRVNTGAGWSDWSNTTVKSGSFSHTGVVPGTKYQYRVKSWDGIAWSNYSNKVTLTARPGIPGRPSYRLFDGDQKLLLFWEPVEGAEVYRVYRRVDGGEWEMVMSKKPRTQWTDTDIQPGHKYTYRVRAGIELPDGTYLWGDKSVNRNVQR